MKKHPIEQSTSSIPVNDEARCQLQQLQQSLGLGEEVINAVEAQVIQAHEQKLQQNEKALIWANQRQYPLSDEEREVLENRRQKLNLSKKIADLIEAKVTETYKQTLLPEKPDSRDSESILTNNGFCPLLPTSKDLNPIIPVAVPIEKPITKLGGKHKEKVRRLLLKATTVIVVTTVGAIASYAYIQWQADQSARAGLERAENLKESKKYEECANGAKVVSHKSRFYSDAQNLLNQCQRLAQDEKWLAEAKELAKNNNFKDAIAAANKIQSGSSFQQEAQQLISLSSENLLEQAEGQYKQSYNFEDLEDAIIITKGIPKNSSVAKKIEETVKKWRTEWNNNENYLQEAQNAIKEGNWQKAIDKANQVRLLGQKVEGNTPYWQNKMKPIIEIAQKRRSVSEIQKTATNRQFSIKVQRGPRIVGARIVGPKTVGSRRIAPKTVGSRKIAPKTVGSRRIAPKTVSSKHVGSKGGVRQGGFRRETR